MVRDFTVRQLHDTETQRVCSGQNPGRSALPPSNKQEAQCDSCNVVPALHRRWAESRVNTSELAYIGREVSCRVVAEADVTGCTTATEQHTRQGHPRSAALAPVRGLDEEGQEVAKGSPRRQRRQQALVLKRLARQHQVPDAKELDQHVGGRRGEDVPPAYR